MNGEGAKEEGWDAEVVSTYGIKKSYVGGLSDLVVKDLEYPDFTIETRSRGSSGDKPIPRRAVLHFLDIWVDNVTEDLSGLERILTQELEKCDLKDIQACSF